MRRSVKHTQCILKNKICQPFVNMKFSFPAILSPMKRILFLSVFLFLLSGCGKEYVPTEKEPTPAEIAQMTEEEREAEIAKIFSRIGVALPENWSEMNKQERGRFILKYGLGVDPNAPIQK